MVTLLTEQGHNIFSTKNSSLILTQSAVSYKGDRTLESKSEIKFYPEVDFLKTHLINPLPPMPVTQEQINDHDNRQKRDSH